MASLISLTRVRNENRASSGRYRVLVTEDNPALRQLMADVLKSEGYSVTEAANAAEMQRFVLSGEPSAPNEDRFDLIVSDLFMPGKNGLNALAELRQVGVRSQLLIVTSFPDRVAYEYVEKTDVQLLAKPFTLRELREIADAMLHPPRMTSGTVS